MYRDGVHGRKGVHMMAISAVDCALWDLQGQWLGVAGVPLAGRPGPRVDPGLCQRARILAGARSCSRAGAAIRRRRLHGDEVVLRAGGRVDGRDGIRKVVELAETLREAIGPRRRLHARCLDELGRAVHGQDVRTDRRHRPRWIEEPVLPDKIDATPRSAPASACPISTGEHEYTRWGIKQLLDAEAVDVLQPDTYWAGGITEMLKIGALASAYDIPVIPHGHSVPANVHLSLAWPITQVPFVEFLVKWQQLLQHFWKEPMVPVNGQITASERPGFGMELDESKIESERDLTWDRPSFSAASVQVKRD